MTSKELMFYLSDEFGDKVRYEAASMKRLYIRVMPEDLRSVIQYIFNVRRGRLSTATGLDTREGIEVMYHFSFNGHPLVATVRVTAVKPACLLDSVQDFMKGAFWIEREIHEMLGVYFDGNPRMDSRLLKARHIPADVFPLRKDFDVKKFKESIGEA